MKGHTAHDYAIRNVPQLAASSTDAVGSLAPSLSFCCRLGQTEHKRPLTLPTTAAATPTMLLTTLTRQSVTLPTTAARPAGCVPARMTHHTDLLQNLYPVAGRLLQQRFDWCGFNLQSGRKLSQEGSTSSSSGDWGSTSTTVSFQRAHYCVIEVRNLRSRAVVVSKSFQT